MRADSHRILIWRERGSRNHPSNIIERDRYGGRGVLVWGGIMLGSRTDLHIFDAGSVNGTRYCNEILLPYVRLFRGAMGLQFLFMDDNAPCHCTVATEQLLESEDIERMDWPAQSADLNPIEHVWDFLGRRLAARTLPPVTIRELRLAQQDEWAAMPQQLIDTLILSMGRRCETCLAVREIISPSKDRMFLAGHPSQGCFGLQSNPPFYAYKVNKDASEKDKALLKLFFMNKESATVALRKLRLRKNARTGKGPSTVLRLIKLVQRFEETGLLEDRLSFGGPNLRIISKRSKFTWPPRTFDYKVYREIVQERGHFYVCGDVSMAEDVNQTLRSVIQEHGHMNPVAVDNVVKRLQVT
ncbi:transposable element Tcb2 transposase [Trichonephila clavipes]|nr:transposable element Tcb2 transposase [Trichonephila clavipes]